VTFVDIEKAIAEFAGVVVLVGALMLALGLSSYVANAPNQLTVTLGTVVFAVGLAILALLSYEGSK
jgi:hypothetical protein